MFYIIGLGLSDEKDITIRGLEVRHFQTTSKTKFAHSLARRRSKHPRESIWKHTPVS